MPAARASITGLGLVTPIGSDRKTFWDALIEGTCGAREVRSFDTSDLSRRVGCEVQHYDVPQEIRGALLGGRCTELAALAAVQAVEDAGVDPGQSQDAAVVVGTTMGEVTRFEQDRAKHPDQEPGPDDVRSLARRPLDVMGRSVARIWGLRGPLITVPAACAAGTYAVGVAASIVARGEAPWALAVGCEAFSRLAFVGFSRMRAMSPDRCRPFSLDRPGLLVGEGAGAVVIEPESAATSRGADVWGHVDGFGLSCDAHHITGPHPRGDGAARAMRDALTRARVSADEIDYVNAHGTGTPLNDRTESLAVRATFGARGATVPVSSIKALTGHMMGASGTVEAIACLLAMRHGTIPPTWNWVEKDSGCDIDCVPNQPREARLRRVLSNSYAFGGNNASLLLSAATV